MKRRLGLRQHFQNQTNGTFTLLLDFDGTNGGSPEASLIWLVTAISMAQPNAAALVILTVFGTLFGPYLRHVFQLNYKAVLTSILSFDGNYDGDAPLLTLAGKDGGLYGHVRRRNHDLSLSGGSFGDGTVFDWTRSPPLFYRRRA